MTKFNNHSWKKEKKKLSRTKRGCPLSALLFSAHVLNTVLEVLASSIRQEKEISDLQLGKGEIRLLQFTDDDMIIYVEKSYRMYKKILIVVTGELSDFAGFEFHKEKGNTFL